MMHVDRLVFRLPGWISVLRFVHLSSQRTLEPVRQDGWFAEKQEPNPALRLIVRSAHLVLGHRDARFPCRRGSWPSANAGVSCS